MKKRSQFYRDDQGRVRFIGSTSKKLVHSSPHCGAEILHAPAAKKEGYFFKDETGRVIFTGGPSSGGGSTSVQKRQEKTISNSPRSFASLEEAKEWSKAYNIDLNDLDNMQEAAALQAAATLREVQEKVPVPIINAIYYGTSNSNEYSEVSRSLFLTAHERHSYEHIVSSLKNELSTLDETSPRRITAQKQLEILERGNLLSYHSLYHFPISRHIEAVVRHELGHAFHQRFRGGNIYGDKGIDSLYKKYSDNWREKFGITLRGTDNWSECVAENFVFWSMGKTQYIHPEMVSTFDALVRTKK